MRASGNRNRALNRITVSILAALATSAASGQTQQEQEQQVEKISVIGSHIKVNHDTGALPVTSMSEEDIVNSGAISGAELLADIPQQGEVAFNSERAVGGVNDARGDVSSVNLRGLGTGNTLTLLNGRRLVLHPGTQSENFVPVTTVNSNTLPVRGLKRVEVLRDGAAAIYGSDAVASVVNYVLKDDYEGSELNLNYGNESGTQRDAINLSGATGFYLDDEERTHLTLSGGVYSREMLMTSEKDYAASSDLRKNPRFPEEFQDDTQLDNRNTSTPWGEFRSSSLGTFHIQPSTMSGCVQDLGQGICADKGSQSRDLRYDRNSERSLSSGVDRFNLYGLLNHEINDDLELFAEALYYYAEAERVREQTSNLTAQRFTVAADAFYNPFNEDVQVRRYRPVDTGPRNIKVKDHSYRLLTGLKGFSYDWDWESAVLYSKATTKDTANRVNSTLFQQAVNSTDQSTAYNLFNGADVNNPNVGDPTGNNQGVIDSFMMNVVRDSETELALIDFKASRADLFELPAGEVGFAFGTEWRYESFSDVRSEVLNTSQPFKDLVKGTKNPNASVVLGSSPTPDSSGSRNVFSAYAELAVPLLEGLPAVERLDMQIAARYEKFSDVGSVFKPKVALSWIVSPYLQVRGSYAEGFKAPGLPQVVAVDVSRVNTRSDPVFDARQGVLEVRNGSADLKPEESENIAWGVVIQPTDNLTLTLDWWRLEQEKVVGLLHSQTQILYDALLRSQGSSNPNVIRDGDNEIVRINNDYVNLLPREAAGVDISLSYNLKTDFGRFKFKVNGAKLTKFEQGADAVTQKVLDAQAANNPAVQYRGDNVSIPLTGDLIRQNGRPEWRSTASIGWKKDQWGAGLKYRYISDFEDTGLDRRNEQGEQVFYQVDSFSRLDAYVNYTLPETLLEKTRITLGVRNLSDRKPPIADDSFGYEESVHSSMGRYVYFNLNKKF